MSQSRRQTLVEVITNTATGFVGSWWLTMLTVVYIHDKVLAATISTVLCTLWSLARGYVLRRYFNRKHGHLLKELS